MVGELAIIAPVTAQAGFVWRYAHAMGDQTDQPGLDGAQAFGVAVIAALAFGGGFLLGRSTAGGDDSSTSSGARAASYDDRDDPVDPWRAREGERCDEQTSTFEITGSAFGGDSPPDEMLIRRVARALAQRCRIPAARMPMLVEASGDPKFWEIRIRICHPDNDRWTRWVRYHVTKDGKSFRVPEFKDARTCGVEEGTTHRLEERR